MDDRTCSVEGCDRRPKGRGMCTYHWEKWRATSPEFDQCETPGCGKPSRCKGLCQRHYNECRRKNGLEKPSQKKCTSEGCERTLLARGMCRSHYQRWRAANPTSKKTCSIAGCGKVHCARGWCAFHYTRWKAEGDPLALFANKAVGRYTDDHSCKSPGCERKVRVNGWCHQCNKQFKYGATAKQLAERDGADCSICGKPVDMSLNRTVSLMGPSVDHVVPRSRGGGDEAENLALAHLLCNIRKGNRTDQARAAA